MEKKTVEVQTFNWGPCVIKIKTEENFKKILADEALKNEQDYSPKLAAQIKKATEYSKESQKRILPVFAPYLELYRQCFQNYHRKDFIEQPEYALTSLWCNYQRQYEFNPPHDHDGILSFVIYLSIPDELKEENKAYTGRSCGPGGIQFIYGEGAGDSAHCLSDFPKEGEMFIFPAWLKHWVFPFRSDVTRVSVSGNVHITNLSSLNIDKNNLATKAHDKKE